MKKIIHIITIALIIASSRVNAAAPTTPTLETPPATPTTTTPPITPPPAAPIIPPMVIPPIPAPPIPAPSVPFTIQQRTDQDLDNYVNALIRKLYRDSNLQHITKTAISANPAQAQAEAQSLALANKQATNFAAALQRAYNPPITPGPALDQANDYKARLFDILRNLAMNNMAAVNLQISSLPDPLDNALYPPITIPLTYDGYLSKQYNGILYQTILQVLVHKANLFPNITKTEIEAFMANVP